MISASHNVPKLRPGQLWVWNFSVSDGTWPFHRITTEGRRVWFSGGHIILKRGEQFMLVSLDDPGPYEMKLPKGFNDIGQIVYEPVRRWHVGLSKGNLFWIEHIWFEQAELVIDVV